MLLWRQVKSGKLAQNVKKPENLILMKEVVQNGRSLQNNNTDNLF